MELRKLFVASGALYLLGLGILTFVQSKLDIQSLLFAESERFWLLYFIRDIGFSAFCFLAVVSPFYFYFKTQKPRYLTLIALALVGNVGFIGMMLHISDELADIPVLTNKRQISQPTFKDNYQKFLHSEQVKTEEQARITVLIASSIYIDSGETVEVVTENGQLKTYSPTPHDMEMRTKLLLADKLNQHMARAAQHSAHVHIILLISAIFVGLISTWITKQVVSMKRFRRS